MAIANFGGKVYGVNVYASTLTELKRKLSLVANGYFEPIDYFEGFRRVQQLQTIVYEPFKLTRINKKYPNNTIKRGVWH